MRFVRIPILAKAAILAAVACTPALAQARPDVTRMSCTDAAALVNKAGAIVLTTGPDLYDRYVKDLAYCYWGQNLKPEWVRTRDKAQCFIGYTCYEPSRDRAWGW